MKKRFILAAIFFVSSLSLAQSPGKTSSCPLTQELAKKCCGLTSSLETTQAPFAKCVIAAKGQPVPMPIVAMFDQPFNPMIKERARELNPEISPTGKGGTLPLLNVVGLGDEAFLIPCYELNAKQVSDLDRTCFTLYIKRGSTLYQFVSYEGKDRCSVEETKRCAKEILGGAK